MKIIIDNKEIYADGYILQPQEKAVQFYKEKSDYIPPIKVDEEMLSDFGREVFGIGK